MHYWRESNSNIEGGGQGGLQVDKEQLGQDERYQSTSGINSKFKISIDKGNDVSNVLFPINKI